VDTHDEGSERGEANVNTHDEEESYTPDRLLPIADNALSGACQATCRLNVVSFVV